jgi:uncharacterized delta-60 repeat protein
MSNTAPVLTTGSANGIVRLDFRPLRADAPRVLLQADGKIVIDSHVFYPFSSIDYSELIRFNADGSLDTAFGGTDGVVSSALNSATGTDMALQADGKLVVAGAQWIARYNSDGSFDTSFGTGGKVNNSGSTTTFGAAVQAGGKIVIAGGDGTNLGLARYDSGGNLDSSFGVGGKVTTSFGSSGSVGGYSLVSQPDGKLVVAGYALGAASADFALVRYNSDGSLDTTFGAGGKVTTDFASRSDAAFSVTIQADGKLVAAGYTGGSGMNSSDFSLARYNVDGTLDASFGNAGKVATDISSTEQAESVKIQPDGKIVVAGYSYVGPAPTKSDLVLLRYNSNGSLDSSFGSGGKVVADLGSNHDEATSLVIQPDGKILVVGTDGIGQSSATDIALVRYNSDGSLDTSFGADTGAALSGPAFFVEDGSPTVLNARAAVHDAELAAAGSYSGASLMLARHGGADSLDVFGRTGNLAALTEGGNVVLSGLTIGTVTHNSAGMLLLTFGADATEARVNEAMRDITYVDASDTPGALVQIDWSFSDGNSGAQGSGGALTAAGSTTVHVTAVNDLPVATVPAGFSTPDNIDHAITGLSVSDPDSTFLLTFITVQHGTLTIAAVGGAFVSGSGTGSITLGGSAAQIAATLAAANNVLYHSTAGFHGTDSLSIHSVDGDGIGATATVAIEVTAKHAGFDFNGDGFSDILWRNNSTGDTGYSDIHNNAFQSLGGSPTANSVVGTGDFNGDHFSDVLWRNTSTGDTGYTDIHNGVFHSLGGSPTTYSVVGAGDFNGDNFSDILWRNNSTGDTGYSDVHNNAFHSLGGSSSTYSVVGVGDFNADNFSDILWRNNSTGDTGYSDVHNGAFHSLGGSSSTYSVASVGDFNGDSFSDILWRANSTGDTGYSDLHNNAFHSLGGSPTAYSVVGTDDTMATASAMCCGETIQPAIPATAISTTMFSIASAAPRPPIW